MPMVPPIFAGSGVIYDLSDLSTSYFDRGLGDDTYRCQITFRVTTDATVDVLRAVLADQLNQATYAAPAVGGTLYVRCTQTSGPSMNTGDTLGVWNSLTAAQERTFGHENATGGGPDLATVIMDFEIATDASGLNVVASKDDVTIQVGQLSP